MAWYHLNVTLHSRTLAKLQVIKKLPINKRDVVPILLTSAHHLSHKMNTHEQDMGRVPLISNFLITCNFASASKCNVTFEQYSNQLTCYLTPLLEYMFMAMLIVNSCSINHTQLGTRKL